ncbi:MAG: 7-cyano-7-deazaguanine synthase, partial [Rhizomicrobium sp.]
LARMREYPHWKPALAGDHILPLHALSAIGGSALITGERTVGIDGPSGGLPATFVPGRNVLFLAAAAALAYRLDMQHLIAGMCETDYSGYPDCRDETIKAVGRALDLGMDRHFAIHTPLMHIDKEATWKLAEMLGGQQFVQLIVDETVTCYEGNREFRHDWGFGCGACAACRLRARGYERYVAP